MPSQDTVLIRNLTAIFCTRLRGFHLACTSVSGVFGFVLLMAGDTHSRFEFRLVTRFNSHDVFFEFIELAGSICILFAGINFIAFLALRLCLPDVGESEAQNHGINQESSEASTSSRS